MNISNRIQHLRKVKGISQEELAQRIGVSRQAVSKWESNQSVPDMERIILMSDYFEVSTDYLLKGVETSTQGNRTLDARIFSLLATAFNFIGLVVAIAIWYEEQRIYAILIGFVFLAIGCITYGIGHMISSIAKDKAKQMFWCINIWLLSFMPCSIIYNMLVERYPSPYPLMRISFTYPLFWILYIAFCSFVVYHQNKLYKKQ